MDYKTGKLDAATLLDAGAAMVSSAKFVDEESHPYIVVPEGYKIADMEKFMSNPTRKRGTVSVSDSRSFVDFLVRHGNEHDAAIYADMDAEESRLNMTAVLNDHDYKLDIAGWMDHRCVFQPKLSVEWKRWITKDGVSMNQSDFATFLEDNLGDIASVEGMPTGAQMLTMALQFEANSEKRLRSTINTQSGGTQFEYVDEETKETRTTMTVFQRFTIGVPVFQGSKSAYPIVARLKYRAKDGKVNFWFELIRPDLVFKTAADEETSLIAAATGFLIFNGKI